MVFRVFVEKKPGLDNDARALLNDAKTLLGIKGVERVRLLNRYDVENINSSLTTRLKPSSPSPSLT